MKNCQECEYAPEKTKISLEISWSTIEDVLVIGQKTKEGEHWSFACDEED